MRQKAHIGGRKVYVEVGFYDPEQTQIGEIFITVDRSGTKERFLIDSLARTASLAIQYGTPVDKVMEQWMGTRYQGGVVQGDEHVKMCLSTLDYVAKHILIHYCGRMDLVPR